MSFCLHLWPLYTRSTGATFLFCATMGKVKTFTAVKQPMQSKELHKNRFTFCFTKSTEAQTGKGDDKRIRLCFEYTYTKIVQASMEGIVLL